MKDLSIRIAGEAGQGVQTTGDLLTSAFAGMGLHVFSTQSYWSRIRGGLNWYDIRAADEELWSGRRDIDVMVALTPFALERLRGDVKAGGVTLFDGESAAEGVAALPFTKTAEEVGGAKVMANAVAAGAVFAILGYDVGELARRFEAEFGKKGDKVVEKNTLCARRGAEMAAERVRARPAAPAPSGAPGTVYNGSEAIGLSAAVSGVKFVTAYPMTPSTGTFAYLAGAADRYGILVEQAEDEIAAVNMACGATFAGAPALVTTSGGGFALMVEGVSLAGMLELPVVIMDAQRPGPATGLPTRTGQEDLKFVITAGHGEFPRAVFAPGTAEEAYRVTRIALETAHKYQTPVVILSDQYLADTKKNIRPLSETAKPIDRHVEANPGEDYLRYAVTESGVSPRALPGGGALVVCDSDEHTEDGHITEDLEARVRLEIKRLRKGRGLCEEAMPPTFYGARSAKHFVVSWGSTYGPAREAVDILNGRGGSFALVHFPQVWPLSVETSRKALGIRRKDNVSSREITVVEGNATGQFASLLREAGILAQCNLLTKFDGLPFTGDEIAERMT